MWEIIKYSPKRELFPKCEQASGTLVHCSNISCVAIICFWVILLGAEDDQNVNTDLQGVLFSKMNMI